MGILTPLSLKELNAFANSFNMAFTKLEATQTGIHNSTYITYTKDKAFILKLYEFSSFEEIEYEQQLLKTLNSLCVPRFKTVFSSPTFSLKGYPATLQTLLKGSIPTAINKEHIKEIAIFLAKMHQLTKGKKQTNKAKYTPYILKKMIDLANQNIFYEYFEEIKDIVLENEGIIHGDLFPDNCTFVNEQLSGVFDFIEACEGAFIFDVAVMINSWCFKADVLQQELLELALKSYNQHAPKPLSLKELKKAMLFAALFYAVARYKVNYIEQRACIQKDHNEYLKKFNIIRAL